LDLVTRIIVFGALAFVLVGCGGKSRRSQLIVFNDSIAGVQLGEPRSEVEHDLGAGHVVARPSRITVALRRGVDVLYPSASLVVAYEDLRGDGQRVIAVWTDSPHYRTASGIGVGTRFIDFERRLEHEPGFPSATPVTTGEGRVSAQLRLPLGGVARGPCCGFANDFGYDATLTGRPGTTLVMDHPGNGRIVRIAIANGWRTRWDVFRR
jgi:hypothetical protein